MCSAAAPALAKVAPHFSHLNVSGAGAGGGGGSPIPGGASALGNVSGVALGALKFISLL